MGQQGPSFFPDEQQCEALDIPTVLRCSGCIFPRRSAWTRQHRGWPMPQVLLWTTQRPSLCCARELLHQHLTDDLKPSLDKLFFFWGSAVQEPASLERHHLVFGQELEEPHASQSITMSKRLEETLHLQSNNSMNEPLLVAILHI